MCREAATANGSVPAQTPARAMKRQQQRERRKLAKAEGAAVVVAGGAAAGRVVATGGAAVKAPAAAALAASPLPLFPVRLVLKHTFIDAYDEGPLEDSDGSQDLDLQTPELPAALFETSAEFEEWRIAYRRFRLGSHVGARGEYSAPRSGNSLIELGRASGSCSPQGQEQHLAADALSAVPSSAGTVADALAASAAASSPPAVLAERATAEARRFEDEDRCLGGASMPRWSAAASAAEDATTSAWESSSAGPATNDSLDGLGETGKVPTRALKRQRQRERRRLGKAEARAKAYGLPVADLQTCPAPGIWTTLGSSQLDVSAACQAFAEPILDMRRGGPIAVGACCMVYG